MRYGKFDDLLKLARKLAGSAEGMTLDEMAAEMGTTRRTVDRMRAVLEQMFPQWETVSDGHRKRFRIPGGLDGFLQMPSVDELAELRVAIATLKTKGDTTRAGLLGTLYDKVHAALRPAARLRMAPDLDALLTSESQAMQAGLRPLDDPTILETIRTALKAGCAVTFLYKTGSNRLRQVTPWGLLYGPAAYYLVAPGEGKTEPALWRLDRMHDIKLSDAPATPPPAQWDLEAFAARSFGIYQDTPHDVILRFTPEAAEDAALRHFHPTQELERLPDGSLIVRYHAGGLQEQAFYLFTWGTAVEILAPVELRTELCRLLRKALEHHEHTPGP
ncbi:WYL domain-containing protein [Novacetimonas maltaceti]|uniref:Uncharacterized protein n=1 Tax=Novacetimonas maltaceti TaxID=1203393 RepID=A0A2S3W2C7_9PROT|nr:WYL domain-containing protein [Novacetimonas maltaceti]POF63045.1 hypothetical protein KMAL_12830 [Novacetimonas maltaceti]PYD59942.1 WYL domain-containing protein [Novacetimonas maltaceti]